MALKVADKHSLSWPKEVSESALRRLRCPPAFFAVYVAWAEKVHSGSRKQPPHFAPKPPDPQGRCLGC